MSLLITHVTGDNTIQDSLKSDLAQAIEKAAPGEFTLKGLSKQALVLIAKHIRDALETAHQAEVEALSKQRQEALAVQQVNPIIKSALCSLRDGFQRHIKSYTANLEEYREAVAKSPLHNIMLNTASSIERTMLACEMLNKLAPQDRYFTAQAAEQTDTVEQILEYLSDKVEMETRDCLRDTTYSHNSSSGIRNLENIQKFQAQQRFALIMQSALKLFNRDLMAETPEAAINGRYINTTF